MTQFKCAILGYGKMGKIRYNTLKKVTNCQVKWIMDVNHHSEIPLGVNFTTNVNDILNDPDTNIVFVCSSNETLKEYTVKALEHQKHVFCEKPPGRSLEELNEMVAAEKANSNQKLMFGFNHRHHESIQKAHEIIKSGEYGQVLWIRGRYGKSVDKNFFDSWRAKKDMAGGGIFLDQGIHMLDIFLMLCDNFDEVKAFVSNCYWKLDVEDNVFAIFRNKNGQVASLHSTMTQWRHLFSLEIFLERGYIVINGLKTSSNTYGDEIMTIAKNRTLPPEASWTEEEDFVFHIDNSWDKEVNIFLDCITHKKKVPIGNSEDALKLMKLVKMVYNSASQ